MVIRNYKLKKILSAILFAVVCYSVNAQVKTKIFIKGIPDKLSPVKNVSIIERVIPEPTEFKNLIQIKSSEEISKDYLNKFAISAKGDNKFSAGVTISSFLISLTKKTTDMKIKNNQLLREHSPPVISNATLCNINMSLNKILL